MAAFFLAILKPLGEFFLGILTQDVVKALEDWVAQLKQKQAEKQQSDDYKKVVDDPSSTREQRKDAEGNVLNG